MNTMELIEKLTELEIEGGDGIPHGKVLKVKVRVQVRDDVIVEELEAGNIRLQRRNPDGDAVVLIDLS